MYISQNRMKKKIEHFLIEYVRRLASNLVFVQLNCLAVTTMHLAIGISRLVLLFHRRGYLLIATV